MNAAAPTLTDRERLDIALAALRQIRLAIKATDHQMPSIEGARRAWLIATDCLNAVTDHGA